MSNYTRSYFIVLLIAQFNTLIAGNLTTKLQIAEEDSIPNSLANSKYVYMIKRTNITASDAIKF